MLAFTVFELLLKKNKITSVVEDSVREIIRIHDVDFERLWNTINRTNMKVLIGILNLIKRRFLPILFLIIK